MWNKFRKTFILLLVFLSSTTSDEGCAIRHLAVRNRMTDILESFNLEANLWIRPESDFEMIEIQMYTPGHSFYPHNHLVLEPKKILNSSYYTRPYWIPLTVKIVPSSSGRWILSAHVNDNLTLEIDTKLSYIHYQYPKYKLSAKGGLSYLSCNPSSSTTESPSDQKTTKDNPISKNSLTRAYKAKSWEEDFRKIESNDIKKTREKFLIVSLTVIAFLSVLIIIALYILECRYKDVDENLLHLSYRKEKGEDNMYVADSTMRNFSKVNTHTSIPPPGYML